MDAPENLIGFLTIVALAAFSIIGKAIEGRQQREEEKERKEQRPKEMSEATRRMLYGDSAPIPMAKPKGDAPPPQRPRTAAAPRPATPPMRPAAAPPPARRRETGEVFRPQAQPQRQAPPRRSQSDPRRAQPVPSRQALPPKSPAAPPQRQRPAAHPDSLGEARRQVQRALQQAWRQAEQRPSVPTAERAHEEQIEGPRQETRPRSEPPAPKKPKRVGTRRALRILLKNQSALRASILMNEVLGPPKALRDS